MSSFFLRSFKKIGAGGQVHWHFNFEHTIFHTSRHTILSTKSRQVKKAAICLLTVCEDSPWKPAVSHDKISIWRSFFWPGDWAAIEVYSIRPLKMMLSCRFSCLLVLCSFFVCAVCCSVSLGIVTKPSSSRYPRTLNDRIYVKTSKMPTKDFCTKSVCSSCGAMEQRRNFPYAENTTRATGCSNGGSRTWLFSWAAVTYFDVTAASFLS